MDTRQLAALRHLGVSRIQTTRNETGKSGKNAPNFNIRICPVRAGKKITIAVAIALYGVRLKNVNALGLFYGAEFGCDGNAEGGDG